MRDPAIGTSFAVGYSVISSILPSFAREPLGSWLSKPGETHQDGVRAASFADLLPRVPLTVLETLPSEEDRFMKCIVTGAAGFIGSHLCEALLRSGHEVVGLDAFVPYYPEDVKRRNLRGSLSSPNFRFHRLDLREDRLDDLVGQAEVIFHLAGMPGLMRSWTDREGYWSCNVMATRKLLEAVQRSSCQLRRFLLASTSSVYGEFASRAETAPTTPVSPYGITKLAAENLCRAYAADHGVPVVTLRYFSVYGPRQRPDMGYHHFIQALLLDKPIVVYGDGKQVRGNTYVDDCVRATIAAVEAPVGEVYNVGGGEPASVWDVLHRLEALAGRPANVRLEPGRPGDQRYTLADTSKLRAHLGWAPRTPLEEGLARQWAWQSRELTVAGQIVPERTGRQDVPAGKFILSPLPSGTDL
jgi:nucleoside-diphosphate-sugar epimerase